MFEVMKKFKEVIRIIIDNLDVRNKLIWSAIILLCIVENSSLAQNQCSHNCIDPNGLKQGYWVEFSAPCYGFDGPIENAQGYYIYGKKNRYLEIL